MVEHLIWDQEVIGSNPVIPVTERQGESVHSNAFAAGNAEWVDHLDGFKAFV